MSGLPPEIKKNLTKGLTRPQKKSRKSLERVSNGQFRDFLSKTFRTFLRPFPDFWGPGALGAFLQTFFGFRARRFLETPEITA